jgi:transposase
MPPSRPCAESRSAGNPGCLAVRRLAPNALAKANRRWKNFFSPVLYRQRNAVERMFGRLKDFRRIATRYDRLARNSLAALCLAAILCYWLWVRCLGLDQNLA